MKKNHYEIWQLKEECIEKYGFKPYEEVEYDEEKDEGFERRNYVKVYEGDVETGENEGVFEMLEILFMNFNVCKPSDFKGHSMSVSDVVVINYDRAFYCDAFGWKEVDFENYGDHLESDIEAEEIFEIMTYDEEEE